MLKDHLAQPFMIITFFIDLNKPLLFNCLIINSFRKRIILIKAFEVQIEYEQKNGDFNPLVILIDKISLYWIITYTAVQIYAIFINIFSSIIPFYVNKCKRKIINRLN